MSQKDKRVYRIEGLSCTSCAGKFQQNVQQLPGVQEATVNFGAGKLSVVGEATLAEIQQAGAFDHLRIQQEHELTSQPVPKESFMKRNRSLLLALVLIAAALLSQGVLGEENLGTVGLYVAAIGIGGYELFKEGIRDLLKLNFTMETLMTIAIVGAAIIGEWAEGAVVVILFAISEALERFSMDQARQSIRSLMAIAPTEAWIRKPEGPIRVNVQEVQPGEVMIIKPGQKIALDGEVIGGHSSVNQAAITGESLPVEKQLGDDVFAGTLNEEGLLEAKVTKGASDTTLATIIHLVEEAQGERAPAQAFVDTFAKYYTPFIMAVAGLVALLPPLLFNGSWQEWLYQGLSLLVVGCPCSLVISTPVSLVSAIGNAAKQGVLIKGGIYLEELGAVKAVAFDKTGTLTKGTPILTDFIVLDDNKEGSWLGMVAALEACSQHPLASAMVTAAEDQGINYQAVAVDEFLSLTGQGIQGTINHVTYLVGNMTLFQSQLAQQTVLAETCDSLQREGKTTMLFGTEKEIIAVIAVADVLRETSESIVHQLSELGIQHTVLLTGDTQVTAEAIGTQAGVTECVGGMLPEDKLTCIKALQQRYGKVAMVGDGVNDAPALAAASIGIAMGGAGTDTALETADIALLGDDLQKMPFAIRLSRQTLRIIKQNISFSLGIKLLALLLVIPGWLTLWLAIIADMGATLLVTLNGLRLMNIKAD